VVSSDPSQFEYPGDRVVSAGERGRLTPHVTEDFDDPVVARAARSAHRCCHRAVEKIDQGPERVTLAPRAAQDEGGDETGAA